MLGNVRRLFGWRPILARLARRRSAVVLSIATPRSARVRREPMRRILAHALQPLGRTERRLAVFADNGRTVSIKLHGIAVFVQCEHGAATEQGITVSYTHLTLPTNSRV